MDEMGRRSGCFLGSSLLLVFLLVIPPGLLAAQPAPSSSVSVKSPETAPVEITAERIEYLQGVDVYEAEGSVVIVQGPVRLTADRVTLFMLSGTMVAEGQVHLTDPSSDIHADRLELDVNTSAGAVTNGSVFIRQSDTLVTGRLLQRFSEAHYRAKGGSFTNCDARDGKVPAWRFTFKDLDLNIGESIYAKSAWFCVNDVPLIPFPTLSYPIQTSRKTGFLLPTVGYDNRFGFHYRQGFFWAMTPSQDLLVTPDYLSNRGYGGDVQYRYVLDRLSAGQWLTSYIQDTEVGKGRALIAGQHRQLVDDNLMINAQAFLMTDPNYLSDLSNSGVQRALPSSDSSIYVSRRFNNGNLYLLGQYLQPLQAGGKDTFQRLPELGYNAVNFTPFDAPLVLGLESAFVNFYREVGFTVDRIDVMPSVSTGVLDIGHVLAVTPQVRFREVYYTTNVTNTSSVNRETFWAGVDTSTRLARRFRREDGRSFLHTIEPRLVYEYVPATSQGEIVQIDAVDDLPKKNLVTYSLNTRLLEQTAKGTSSWIDLLIAQSYHLGSTPNQARDFFFTGTPPFGSLTQPLQPPTVPVQTRKFSDFWTRVVFGNPVSYFRAVDHTLTIDAFYDPYGGEFSQWNTDLRFQHERQWYVEVGQRHTREGLRPRRGDIWNPLSFNEVFAPTRELDFVTLAGAFRGPWGWTFGAKSYYDIKNGNSPETDVVALYRNPCHCWSLGLYYIKFPDRTQYNFMITLAGIGTTENFGTYVIKYLLQPLLIGERALPWPSPYGARMRSASTMGGLP
jgi:LPS-assembly protein